MAETNIKKLTGLLVEKSFKYSEEPVFKLASGTMSSYYIDCRKVTHNPEGKYLIGNIIFEMIKDLDVKAVGGLTMGADPMACAVSLVSFLSKKNIASFSIRKEKKEHGLKKLVEGDVQPGDPVVIVEDVITTGASTIKAIEAAKNYGLNVLKVVALVDRQEGGRDQIRKHVADISSLCTIEDLLIAFRAATT